MIEIYDKWLFLELEVVDKANKNLKRLISLAVMILDTTGITQSEPM